MRRIAVLDAPSNLGLRPPTATSVPGCAKAPGALRDHGLLTRLGARDAGCLTPPRYDAGEWRPGDGVAHAQQIANYSRALADRIGAILDAGEFPVILGGDCSILLGSGVAMNRLGEAVGGRIGLVFVDGHSDFRHPGNASYVGAAAGEDLALVTGRGQPDLAAIEGRRPYFRDVDVVVMGIRAQDEYRLDLQAAGIVTRPVPALRAEGAARSAQWARDQLVDCAGYWVHVDVDVLDPAVMPAVDAPSPGGIAFPELELLLAGLVESPHCLGVEITVFDPDYDPDGSYAEEITSAVASGLAAARTVNARPDLVAAREDLRGGLRRPAPAPTGGGLRRAAPAPAAPATTVVAPPEAPPFDESPDRAEAALLEDAGYPHVSEDAAGTADFEQVPGLDAAPETPGGSPGGSPDGDEDDPAAVAGGFDKARYASLVDSGWGPPGGPIPDDGHRADADPADAEPAPDDAEPIEAALGRTEPPDPEPPDPEPADPEPGGPELPDAEPGDPEPGDPGHDEPAGLVEPAMRLVPRPLGSAPLLDSEPLPATRPGMLRPRPGDEPHDDRFSLPAQRPAFDIGSDRPADVP